MIFAKSAGKNGNVNGADSRREAAPSCSSALNVGSIAGWLPHDADRPVTESEALKLSAVYACRTYLCDFISPLPIQLINESTNEPLERSGLKRLLDLRPNPFQTSDTFRRYMLQCQLFRGNAYAYIVRNTATAAPEQLLPLDPDRVSVKLDADNQLHYLYTAPKPGKWYHVDPQNILHFLGDSNNGYQGESVLRYAARTLHRANAADEYERKLYDNNSHPGGVLSTDTDLSGQSTVDDPSREGRKLSRKEVVRQAWERVHAGQDNAFRVAILDNGLKYEPLKLDSFDESFVSAKDVSVADIARFFGVPLHALGAGKQSYSSNEQNSLEFITGRGMAIVHAWETEMTYKLLLDEDLAANARIKINLKGRLRGDTAAQTEHYRKMHEIGAYSINDILRMEDRPNIPGGDVHYASLNYVPLEDFRELSRIRNMQSKTLRSNE